MMESWGFGRTLGLVLSLVFPLLVLSLVLVLELLLVPVVSIGMIGKGCRWSEGGRGGGCDGARV
jgi:hypothetical protein